MVTKAEQIEILYEFSMSIGTSLDLNKMLKKCLTTFMRKLNCPAGGIHFYENYGVDNYRRNKIISVPRDTIHIKAYQNVLSRIPKELPFEQLNEFYKTLPLIGTAEDKYFSVMEVPGLGVVVLLRKEAFDIVLVKSLGPIFSKLAVSCRACLQNEELIDHKNNLKKLISEKTKELVVKNQQLINEIENRQEYEDALAKSEEKYRELVQNANCIILRWDIQGRITFFNEYAQAFFQYTEKEILGRHVVGTIVPKNESTGRDLRPLMDEICKHPQKYAYNVNENMRKDGTRVWISWTNKILTDDFGTSVGTLSIGSDISDLRKSEQRFKLVAESVSDIIFEWDIKSDSLHWYGDIDTALGYEPGEFPHTLKAWQDSIHPDDTGRLSEAVKHHRASTDPINYEYRIQRKDGSWINWSVHGIPVLDNNGKPYQWIGGCTDITDKKKAEQELIESEARYRVFLANEVYAICIFEMETNRFVDVNEAWLKLYGYKRQEVDHLTIMDVTAEPESTEKALRHSIEKGTVFIPSRIHQKKDGTLFYVELSEGPYVWKGKRLMYALIHDITDRVRAEEDLRQSEERYKTLYKKARETEERYHSLLNSSPDAIAIYDINGRTTYVNDAFTKLFGWVLDEIKETIPYVPDSEKDITIHNVLKVIREGIPSKDFETKRFTKNGDLIDVCISASRFNDHEGKPAGMLVMLRDITESKDSEHKLRQAKEAAESANKAKSAFLANMSHELRTPLNAIIGFAELLTRDSTLSKGQFSDLKTIIQSGEHLLTLINDVLEFSKIEAGRIELNLQSFDFHYLLNVLEEMFHLRAAQKGLYLKFENDGNVPQYIRTDQSRLSQILINLLGNAVKFTQSGGITLKVTGQQKSSTDPEKFFIQFEVIDTGPGIAKKEQDKVFDAFFQINDQTFSHQGTGLGLPISKKFVNMMGGDLTMDSHTGKGTMFSFAIPVERTEHVDMDSTIIGQRVCRLSSDQPAYRLLVVEDNTVNRIMLVKLLKTVGFDVREAENGQEAIRIWEDWRPHLIWMDMRMPVMDGYQATSIIKNKMQNMESGFETIIIALTANAFEEDRLKVMECGCHDFVRKPFRERDIFEMIKSHLNVRYDYENEKSTDRSDVRPNHLSKESLIDGIRRLPADLFLKLKEFTELSDAEMIEQIIEKISYENPQVGAVLLDLAENYAYNEILSLTKE